MTNVDTRIRASSMPTRPTLAGAAAATLLAIAAPAVVGLPLAARR